MKLEEVTPGARITGITGDAPVTVVATRGSAATPPAHLPHRGSLTGENKLDERILYRHDEQKLGLAKQSAAFDLTADAAAVQARRRGAPDKDGGPVRPDARRAYERS